ncbi:hypothetical protein GIB67_031188 [Kingdonia uniflora]|uniref:Uncharacterized protein n=1 Tax=Kingdonia uniflora TaxID=39325 RepID=A0A7J7NK88_9MAGN|nr:hypothetical protein GIB67_031188 [Kingdonia uniflora]
MGGGDSWGLSPTSAPPVSVQSTSRDEHWRHFDNSVNAVSFGFVATAILISMFLVMAIFERFLRPRSMTPSSAGTNHGDLEAHLRFNNPKLIGHPSPKMSIYARGVSVLMPGEKMPTFIAHPAPAPCPPERVPWPHHHYNSAQTQT